MAHKNRWRNLRLVPHSIVVVLVVFLSPLSVAQFEQDRNLRTLATEIFPSDLADAIHEELDREIELQRQFDPRESVLTFFLADRLYEDLQTGVFEGSPTVIWNGFDPHDGRPIFLHEPTGFAYITASGVRIEPGRMDTDGGSIPQILHSVPRFNPWTYGPAYLVHDWIFVAHKCGIPPFNGYSLKEAAHIMAEGIKTLMEVGFRNADNEIQIFPKDEDTLYLMYLAVKSSIARDLWNDFQSVTCR